MCVLASIDRLLSFSLSNSHHIHTDYVDIPSIVDLTNKTTVEPPATAKGTNLITTAVTVVTLGLVVIVVMVGIVALQTRRYKKQRRRREDAMRSRM